MHISLLRVWYIFLLSLCYRTVSAKGSSLVSTSVDLCGPEPEIRLTKSGESAAMTVTLSSVEHRGVCKLRILAPKTHVVNMQFIETMSALQKALKLNQTAELHHPPCMMSVYLPDNPRIPVWKGDPCSDKEMPDVDLLTPDFKIVWNPPSNASFASGRKFVVTAIGHGATCQEQSGLHACMKIGWEPILCITDHLVCDGNPNCPAASTNSDEDEKLCKKAHLSQTSLEQLAVELVKNLHSPSGGSNTDNWLHDKQRKQGGNEDMLSKKTFGNWRRWQEIKPEPNITTTKPDDTTEKHKVDSISAALSKYGPWGYLVLGIVICGTVLLICGLWECCFKRPKTTVDPCAESQQPTTVLIINQEETAAVRPPNYDDLDQPPSYSTLFPNFFKSNVCTSIAAGLGNSSTSIVAGLGNSAANLADTLSHFSGNSGQSSAQSQSHSHSSSSEGESSQTAVVVGAGINDSNSAGHTSGGERESDT